MFRRHRLTLRAIFGESRATSRRHVPPQLAGTNQIQPPSPRKFGRSHAELGRNKAIFGRSNLRIDRRAKISQRRSRNWPGAYRPSLLRCWSSWPGFGEPWPGFDFTSHAYRTKCCAPGDLCGPCAVGAAYAFEKVIRHPRSLNRCRKCGSRVDRDLAGSARFPGSSRATGSSFVEEAGGEVPSESGQTCSGPPQSAPSPQA